MEKKYKSHHLFGSIIPYMYILLSVFLSVPIFAAQPPNVIVILTDDQGYGDIGAHGNPWLKTPTQNLLGGDVYYSQHDGRAGKLATNGFAVIDVEKAGKYQIRLRRYPDEANLAMNALAPNFAINRGIHDEDFKFYQYPSKALIIKKAQLTVGKTTFNQPVIPSVNEMVFTVDLALGEQKTITTFQLSNGDNTRAYYTYIEPVLTKH